MNQVARADEATAAHSPILEPGRNCWLVEEASRVGVVIDAADYFAAFAEACLKAKRQIVILGWDFDRHERLHRDDEPRDYPDELGAFLVHLVKQRPELNVYLLSWDFNMIYAAERELLPALRLRAQAPPRFHFRLDGRHPKGASHHQKIVVVDNQLAFVGGIDLSRWRWDTHEHAPDDPRRVDPNGKPYPPFHDMMFVIEGKAAARLGELARERWHRVNRRRIKDVPSGLESPWPDCVQPVLHDAETAIARTFPAYNGNDAVDEVKRLHLDMIAAAERFIYIENQYFTARCLADAIRNRLREKNGPEVVLVLPEHTGGWLEQVTMDVLRARVVARMQQADEHGRLHVLYPHREGLGDTCISVHAKLMIIDDRALRLGSANASSRSMGLDTECDVAIESHDSGDDVGLFITDFRRRLMAEHLGQSVERVEQAESKHTTLIDVIEELGSDERGLKPLDCSVSESLDEAVPDSGLIDPTEPFSGDYFMQQYVPKERRKTGRKRLFIFVGVIVALLALAAAWRWTPLQEWATPERMSQLLSAVPSEEGRAAVAIGGFALASLAMIPLMLLAVVAGIMFEGWKAFLFILAAALLSSATGFLAGRFISGDTLRRLGGTRWERVSRRLAKRGIVAVAVLRLVPIAPFAVFNLVAGGSHVTLRQFMLGSLLGLAPGLGAITLFSDSLWQTVQNPSASNIAIVAAVGVLLLGFTWFARRWLRTA